MQRIQKLGSILLSFDQRTVIDNLVWVVGLLQLGTSAISYFLGDIEHQNKCSKEIQKMLYSCLDLIQEPTHLLNNVNLWLKKKNM